jgi:hypothetical protein
LSLKDDASRWLAVKYGVVQIIRIQ